MNVSQENQGTIFKDLTPEQERLVSKLKTHVALIINRSPNKKLPLEVLIEQGSISASRKHMVGALALAADHYLAVDFNGEDGEILSLNEPGQSWIEEKQAQKADVEA
jgi:hypothetical protein